jgi:hypothetical protein
MTDYDDMSRGEAVERCIGLERDVARLLEALELIANPFKFIISEEIIDGENVSRFLEFNPSTDFECLEDIARGALEAQQEQKP